MSARNHAFDFLCGICIIRMMLNHITGMCGLSGEDWWETTYFWSFSFVSFFFFKAGYFNKTTGGSTREYCKNKARQLMVPYLIWGAIGSLVYFGMMPFIVQRYHHPIEPLEWEHIWRYSTFYGNSPVWFLCSFFMAYIAMHFIGRLRHGQWMVLLFPVVSYWLYRVGNPLWFSLNNVFMCIFVFLVGHLWHVAIDAMGRRNTFLVSAVLMVLFCLSNVLFHGEYDASSNQWTGHPLAITVNLTLVLCGLSGLLMSLQLPRIPVIGYIGQHSMVYFVAHYPMIVLYRLIHISFGRSIQGRWDDWVLLVIIVPALCTWLVPYVERVPWLSGRYPKKEKTT